MHHVKTDSDLTSSAPSSPARPPAMYYVQSPSRDSSHDGEKTINTGSFHSSPMGSPPHSRDSNSSVGHHSRDSSSSTRFSASHHNKFSGGGRHRKGGGDGKRWNQCDVIEEEGLLEDEEGRHGISRRCYFPIFVLAFVLLFTFFSLILWGASRSQKPKIIMKSIMFENFNIQAGTDASLVPTEMATLNSTLKFSFRNTGSFFGVHVTSTPIDLSYYQLTLATGNIKEFYQSRKSQRTVNVVVIGNRVPLYGGGASLTSLQVKTNTTAPPVPLNLSFTVRSKAFVLGQLVKPRFYISVHCSVNMDQTKLNKPVSLKNSCQVSL